MSLNVCFHKLCKNISKFNIEISKYKATISKRNKFLFWAFFVPFSIISLRHKHFISETVQTPSTSENHIHSCNKPSLNRNTSCVVYLNSYHLVCMVLIREQSRTFIISTKTKQMFHIVLQSVFYVTRTFSLNKTVSKFFL